MSYGANVTADLFMASHVAGLYDAPVEPSSTELSHGLKSERRRALGDAMIVLMLQEALLRRTLSSQFNTAPGPADTGTWRDSTWELGSPNEPE